MPRRYLLSIDGGGLRGIISAAALAKLEATTGRPARETFSFAAGTSTGAIIAAAIAAGIPATSIVELYVERAREVFTGVTLVNTLRRIFTGSMYSTRRLHDVISGELGPEARDWFLNHSPIDFNPVYQACVEAFYYTDPNGYRPGRLRPSRWERGDPSDPRSGVRRGSGPGCSGSWANC